MQTSIVIKCDSTHVKALAMLGTQKILTHYYYSYYSAESGIQQNQNKQTKN